MPGRYTIVTANVVQIGSVRTGAAVQYSEFEPKVHLSKKKQEKKYAKGWTTLACSLKKISKRYLLDPGEVVAVVHPAAL